jgi:predicted MFS family arabinose efflux permease
MSLYKSANLKKTAILFTLAAINFTHIVDSMIIMPLGDMFIKVFELEAYQYALLVSSYSIAAAFSSFVGIFYLDKFDRKALLLFVNVGFSVGTLLCCLATDYYTLLTMRLFTGFFGGFIGAIVLSIVSDIYAFSERGRAMGRLFAAFSAATAFGVPFGIYLAAKSGWQLPFLILGLLGIVINIFIYFTFPKLDKHLSEVPMKISFSSLRKDVFGDQNQVNGLMTGFTLIMGHFMIIPFISPYMMANVGFTQENISLQFFLGGAATLFSAPLIGKLVDKFGTIKVFVITMIVSFIPTMVITTLNIVPLWYAYIFTTLFYIFASGRMIAANALISASAPISTRGSFMSLNSSFQQLAISFTGLISGLIVVMNSQGKYENYPILGIVSLGLCVGSYFLLRKLKVAKGN